MQRDSSLIRFVCITMTIGLVAGERCGAAPIPGDLPAATQPAASTRPAAEPAVVERRMPAGRPKPRTRPTRKEADRWLVPPEDVPRNMRLLSFTSDLVNGPVSYTVYLPPGYHDEQRMRYPVIYELPGMAGDCRGLGLLAAAIDAQTKKGNCPPMILVGVQGVYGSYYMDSRDGGRPVESVIVKELIGRIDNTFRTIPDREHRAVEGIAMGGWGAAHLGFKYPELFGVVSIVSAPLGTFDFFLQEGSDLVSDVWGNDRAYFQQNDPFELAVKNREAAARGRTKVRILCGELDRYAMLNEDFHKQLEALEVLHTFDLVPGSAREMGQVLVGIRDRAMTFWKDVFPPYVPPANDATTTSRPTTTPATDRAMP